MISFTHKRFEQLSNRELYDALKLRSDIFVVEQNCIYPDLDDKDTHPDAKHILAMQDKKVLACARVLPPGLSYSSSSIGRVAVHYKHRGHGLARAIMIEAIALAFNSFSSDTIEIGAQCYLHDFYASLGFSSSSRAYDEDGIMHVDMILKRD